MDGRRKWSAGVAAVAAAAGLCVAPAAMAATGVSVSSVSSLKGKAGTLTGKVVNDTGALTHARITVSLHKRGAKRAVVGGTATTVKAHASARFNVAVKLPKRLAKGTYYLSACTPSRLPQGGYGCATAQDEIVVGAKPRATARVSQAAECSSGARTLSKPGMRVYPEMGNGGYESVHTDIFLNYDAPSNLFLPGTHVDLTQKATQCLTDFSLDFERTNSITSTTTPGPNLQVTSVLINGQPATFEFKRPTFPGNPHEITDESDPNYLPTHAASNNNPVSATNPNPPACAPAGTGAAAQGVLCPANKLVITPAEPIPAGAEFEVTVNYTGRPGVHLDGDGSTEGWFRNNNPVGDGAFVTTEPVGSMAWMPLNNHPSVKPTYEFWTTTNWDAATGTGRTAISNGRLIGFTDNPPDANFPGGSRTWHWKSPEPIANYLVENSVGNFDMTERFSPSGVVYYEAQSSAITESRKATNKAIMDQQEDITHFQELFNGQFPFSTNGVIVGIPTAGFEEEMQTKITFQGSSISLGTFHHENMHQWWGDNVSEDHFNRTFFKEGYAQLSSTMNTAWTAAKNAGGLGTPAGDAAFENTLVNSFNNFYNGTSTSPWAAAPSNPSNATLFSNSTTYTRPAQSYLALRYILGPDNWVKANKEIQTTFGGKSISQAEQIAIYKKHMPNKSQGCLNKLDVFFKQWWDTAYSGPPAQGNKPSITAPGLAGNDHFYDAEGGCSPYGVDRPSTPGATVPATLSLTLGAPATFAAFTPGVAKEYTATTTATIISTAGDALLTSSDPGHLMNGSFALPQPLQVSFSKSSWDAPASNDVSTITFTQAIGANDALRTGTYSKTLTFTLSTTTP